MSDFSSPTGGNGTGAPHEALGAEPSRRSRVEPSASPGQVVVHRVRVDPSRSLKAITGEIEVLLDGLEENSRRCAALLASELIAQVIGREPGSNREAVGLIIQLREDAVRLEVAGAVAPPIEVAADHGSIAADPLADWGRFVIDRLSDRWGISGGARRDLWAEIEVVA